MQTETIIKRDTGTQEWTAKFHGKTYIVEPTGRTIRKPAKSFVDFNGYENDKKATSRKQLGMYIDGNLKYTIGSDGKSVYSTFTANVKYGEVFIKKQPNSKERRLAERLKNRELIKPI